MGSHLVTDKNRLTIIRPDLSEEWSSKNPISANTVAINCTKKVWWKCKKCGFEWESKVVSRNNHSFTGKGGRTHIFKTNTSFCPYCASKIIKDEKLMREWDYEKNKINPVYSGCKSIKVWWKCSVCNYSWEEWVGNRIRKVGGDCPKCNSLQTKFPYISKEFSSKNEKMPYEISYGTSNKYIWECSICHHEWIATVLSRTNGGNGCPKCSKIKLKDGTMWDSKTEAYFYLQLKKSGKKFLYNGKYKGLNKRYDFYLPEDNKYIEITAFHKNSRNVNYAKYMRNIVIKKRHVENNLKSNFEFIQIKLSRSKEEELKMAM